MNLPAIKKMKRYVVQLPKLLRLLLGLLKDARVPAEDKAILAAAVAYALSPADFVPDAIPFFGLVDDLYLIALALIRLLNHVDEEVLRAHWQGDEDLLPLIREAARLGARLLPARVRQAVVGTVSGEERVA